MAWSSVKCRLTLKILHLIYYTSEEDSIKIAISKLTKGRFILATNQLDIKLLPTETILSEYKEQSKTESGFKFIKDNSFEVSSIFLKKAERISALMMIMTFAPANGGNPQPRHTCICHFNAG